MVINNDILEDIQVIEPEIRSSDQKLYQVSSKATMTLFVASDCFQMKDCCIS